MTAATGAAEWRRAWPLPFVALLGMAGSGISVYSTGVFMGELTREFGWSRTQYTSSMTVQLVLMLFAIPLIGRAVDRFGPRAVALAGILPTIAATSMLGLANGALWQWWLLAGVQTAGAVTLIPPVWITAVVGRFHHSRGLALAVALAGVGAGIALWPLLAAFYIDLVGWRLAYGAMALSWGVVTIPLAILFFHGPEQDVSLARRPRPAVPLAHHLRSATFLGLAGAGGLFVLICHATTLHLVPILQESGLGVRAAAGMAAVVGVTSIVGRLATGLLLDLVPARRVGFVVFLLPMIVALTLAYGPTGSVATMLAAVVLLGLAMGAEMDVLNYIASRRFDHAVFGSIAAALQTVTAVASVVGVMMASRLYDWGGSYLPFLLVSIPVTAAGALLLAIVPADATPDVASGG